jgi:hypothetical protein
MEHFLELRNSEKSPDRSLNFLQVQVQLLRRLEVFFLKYFDVRSVRLFQLSSRFIRLSKN